MRSASALARLASCSSIEGTRVARCGEEESKIDLLILRAAGSTSSLEKAFSGRGEKSVDFAGRLP